jgi:hypothetical protein
MVQIACGTPIVRVPVTKKRKLSHFGVASLLAATSVLAAAPAAQARIT